MQEHGELGSQASVEADRDPERRGYRTRVLAWPRLPLRRLAQVNPYMLLLVPAFYLATWHAIDGRFPISSSYAPNVLWAHEWAQQFRQGILYPRWMEHPYSGLGTPTFAFYGPLCMYMTLPFTVGLGTSVSYGVLYSFWLALIVMGIGVARLVRTVFGGENRWLPAVIGAMAMVSPYALMNVYPRGALAETWAMATFPWLLAALVTSLYRTRFSARLNLIICTSVFASCHPPSLLLGTTAIGFALLVTLRNWRDVEHALRRVVTPMAVGFMLVAVYLVPAIRDQRYVNIAYLTSRGGPRAGDRLIATDLGHFSFKFVDGFDGIVVPAFLFCCFTMLAIPFLVRRYESNGSDISRKMAFLVGCGAMAAMMMTDFSKGIYELCPVFHTIQFTYRWMVILTICALPLWGYVILLATRSNAKNRLFLGIPVWLFTIWMSTNAYATSLVPVDWNSFDAARTDALFNDMDRAHDEPDLSARPLKDFRGLLHLNSRDELVLEDVSEYHPFKKSDGQFPERTYPRVEWHNGSGAVSDIDWRPSHRRFIVDSPTGGTLLVRTTAWLGWKISVNGNTSVGEERGEWGRMVVRVPRGRSQVRIDYHGTPNQRLGQVLSVVTLAMLLLYGTRRSWLHRFAIAAKVGASASIEK